VTSKTAWKVEYKTEIERANASRLDGNEGMARVCARRAAGIVIGEYLNRLGYNGVSNSAYDRLALFTNLPEVDEKYREIAQHFLMKVNADYKSPMKVDLVNEVIWLKENLIKDSND
jgi:hypothetical protein